jgi:hypothetical protein
MEVFAMKNSVNFVFGLALVAGSGLAFVATAPVQAENNNPNPNTVCLVPDEIKFTQTKDAKTILFTMRDGTVWQNTLAASCPSLTAHGSAWSHDVRANRICANQQQITLLETGQVCRLGTFTRVK